MRWGEEHNIHEHATPFRGPTAAMESQHGLQPPGHAMGGHRSHNLHTAHRGCKRQEQPAALLLRALPIGLQRAPGASSSSGHGLEGSPGSHPAAQVTGEAAQDKLRNTLCICLGCIVLRQVGHFFCFFTASNRHSLQ